MAMGVVMATYKLTREQALDLLRISSQRSNRRLVEIAAEVVDTGVLNLPQDRVEEIVGQLGSASAPADR
jgi:ANTAR domain